ncbi:venom allergen 5.01 [Procambarus clarkii]|uniref:venom allergen 5.01 n=1 Tax=Procambarus clarkii TaxID=6728 RepID=UPI001E6708A8|nr:venom allergen 5.01-like [Procambarus clarkii]
MVGEAWLWGVLGVVVVVVVGGGDARAAHQHHQLVKEKEVTEQLALIDRLVDIMLNVTRCDQHKPKDEIKTPKGKAEEEKPAEDVSECDYSELSESHTMLKPKNDACEIHKTHLTKEEKEEVLFLHNTLRAKVARGEETRGSPGPQPPAANMRQVVWNDELADVAQAWAAQCPRGHDASKERNICSRDYFVGQNIHYYWGYDEDSDWSRGINEWYDEVADMPSSYVAAFQLHPTKKIGHYTQVVWAETSEVGCGLVYYEAELKGKVYPESKIYVCNYGEAGNIRKWPIYETGPAASLCTKGVSPAYPDLCI